MSLSKAEKREAFKKYTKQQAAYARKAKRIRLAKLEGEKEFWRGQSFGPASEVRRIDPLTGDVIEVIRQHDK
jgi:hypothetical protein